MKKNKNIKMSMKTLLLALFSFGTLFALAQAPPPYINYQGVARSLTGAPLPLTPINLTITISNSSSSYSDQHSLVTNNVGLFSLQIGNGTSQVGSLATFNWAVTPTMINVTIKAGSGPAVPLTPQALVSVPYALYAGSSGSASIPTLAITQNTIGLIGGNSITTPTYSAGTNITIVGPGAGNSYTINATGVPSGTVTGQTAYWNQTSNVWVPNVNLNNDGLRVGVGIGPGINSAKMHIHQTVAADSSALFVDFLGGNARTSAIRGFAIGASNSLNYPGAISGGHFRGTNTGQGPGVGTIAEGFSSNSSGTAIGLYASAYGGNPLNRWAAILDGQVSVSDSMFLFGTANTGATGDILTRSSTGRLKWSTPTAAGAGPWVSATGSTTLTNASDNVFIGTNSGSSKLNVATLPGFLGNDIQVTSAGNSDGLQILKLLGSGSAGRFVNSASTSTSVVFVGNSASGATVIGIDVNVGGNASAINAVNGASVAAIFGFNNSNGPSLRGLKSGGSAAAGQFDHSSITNNGDAVQATNFGKGTAVHAILGPAVAGSSNIAVWLEQGHLRSTGAAPTDSVVAKSAGLPFSVPQVTVTPNGGCSDVCGSYVVNFPTSSWNGGDFVDISLAYNKSYVTNPRVLVNSVGQPMLCYVLGSNAAGVTLRFLNPAGTLGSINNFTFNYFVIEN